MIGDERMVERERSDPKGEHPPGKSKRPPRPIKQHECQGPQQVELLLDPSDQRWRNGSSRVFTAK